MSTNPKPAYRRVLLKLSGEALQGSEGFGIDPAVLERMAQEIKELVELGVQVGLVIGGGNLFRGAGLAKAGMNRVVGDHMGMLATVMNGLAMRDALHRAYVNARLMLLLYQCVQFMNLMELLHQMDYFSQEIMEELLMLIQMSGD